MLRTRLSVCEGMCVRASVCLVYVCVFVWCVVICGVCVVICGVCVVYV